MIHLQLANIEEIKRTHCGAVTDYVSACSAADQDALYANVRAVVGGSLPVARPADYGWLEAFLLADVSQLEYWTAVKAEALKFDFFKAIYKNLFATVDRSVSPNFTYNAYTLLGMMDVKVCPYCDDQYIDVLHPAQGTRRTSDIDHFYPKGSFPGLAMCLFNLIPSDKGCNQVMNVHPLEANPYHPDIETWSRFESLIPVGANLEALAEDDFAVRLHTSGPMIQNDATLAIEERYNHRKEVVRRFLLANQDFTPDKMAEYERLGMSPDRIARLRELSLGRPYPQDRGKLPHQKLRHDLTGY